MSELRQAAVLLLILLASSALAMLLRRFLPERHRSAEAIELVHLVVTMLVTLAALVLGLLTTSVKASFDNIGTDLQGLGADIIRLDEGLRQYGAEAEPARTLLRSYTAATIASTWPSQPRPPGDYYPTRLEMFAGSSLESTTLGDILNHVESDIRAMQPADAQHRRLAADCLARFERLQQRRWKLLEEAHGSISRPFYLVLVFWLVIVFASFGLSAPRAVLSYITIALGAVSIASAIFVILDLDTPFDGFFQVSSAPMRHALAHLSR